MIKSCEIKLAAVEAVKCWNGKEGQFAKRLQSLNTSIDEDFLREWMRHWMVARNINRASHADLAAYLDNLRSEFRKTPCKDVPGMVKCISKDISTKGWSVRNCRPTSLVSKFAFSLRPELIAPYDKRARCALGIIYRSPLRDHEYKAYLSAFQRFARDMEQCLKETKEKMTDDFRSMLLASKMTDRLFLLRSADKALMLIGGYKFNLSPKCVSACFSD